VIIGVRSTEKQALKVRPVLLKTLWIFFGVAICAGCLCFLFQTVFVDGVVISAENLSAKPLADVSVNLHSGTCTFDSIQPRTTKTAVLHVKGEGGPVDLIFRDSSGTEHQKGWDTYLENNYRVHITIDNENSATLQCLHGMRGLPSP